MHIYNQDGKSFPSVTTVIHEISCNEGLMKWANYMGFMRKDISVLTRVSTTFGTKVHSHVRKVVDLTAPEPILARDLLEQRDIDVILSNFKNRFQCINYETLATEKTIISPELGYAGTLDWLANIIKLTSLDKKVLFDFKTSKAIHSTMFLQLGGYYNLLKSIGEDVDYAGIILLGSKSCSINMIKLKDLKYFGECFNKLYDFYTEWNIAAKIKPDESILAELEKQFDNVA